MRAAQHNDESRQERRREEEEEERKKKKKKRNRKKETDLVHGDELPQRLLSILGDPLGADQELVEAAQGFVQLRRKREKETPR